MNEKREKEEKTYENGYISSPVSLASAEKKIAAMVYSKIERDLAEGKTLPAQVYLYFLKMGSQRYEEEITKLRLENEYLREKINTATSTEKLEQMYDEVLESLRSYKVGEIDVVIPGTRSYNRDV